MDVDLHKIKFSFVWACKKSIKLFQSIGIYTIPYSLYILTFQSLDILFASLYQVTILLIPTLFLCTFIFAFINYEDLSSELKVNSLER